MENFKEGLAATLRRVGAELRRIGVSDALAADMEGLAGQVFQPCVVAVVGRVSVGKSSFINALLGEDITVVGATETTSTINHIVYTDSAVDEARPIRCHWRSKPPENVSREFLNGLQTHDESALRLAEAIEYLEYPRRNAYLEQITLVDTPGLSSVRIRDEQKTTGLFGLQQQLRDRNAAETERISAGADAVIFLIRQVALEDAQAFLEEFQQVMGGRSRAFNAVGIMAQIDALPGVMAKRREMAAKIAAQLADSLNTVLPVSAGLQRALDVAMQEDNLRGLRAALRSIPPKRLDMLLSSDEFFTEYEADDCPVSPEERKRLLGTTPWTVFTALARAAVAPDRSEEDMRAHLTDLAGFVELKELLEKRFFQRGYILRGYRIVNDAYRILDVIRYRERIAMLQRQRDAEAQRARLLAFVRQAGGDPQTRRDVETFILKHSLPSVTSEDIENTLRRIDRELGAFRSWLEDENADIEALQQMDDHAAQFTTEEKDELRPLFGGRGLATADRLPLDGKTVAYVKERGRVWALRAQREHSPVRATVAERAASRYGLLLDELLAASAESERVTDSVTEG